MRCAVVEKKLDPWPRAPEGGSTSRSSKGHRICAASGPGPAPQQSPHGQAQAPPQPVGLQGCQREGGAGRRVRAARLPPGADLVLVQADSRQEKRPRPSAGASVKRRRPVTGCADGSSDERRPHQAQLRAAAHRLGEATAALDQAQIPTTRAAAPITAGGAPRASPIAPSTRPPTAATDDHHGAQHTNAVSKGKAAFPTRASEAGSGSALRSGTVLLLGHRLTALIAGQRSRCRPVSRAARPAR